ncbi:fungal-specific transcription factor domain-containing protein [Fusarium avenaceum]|nr:fungal-specific transcription factor domain-containing protein [Fusarium avenaceum]
MADRSKVLPSRRNLPRASHACQRCRAKKAKCDQQQPCGNCVKHSHQCTYGLRGRNGRDRNLSTPTDGLSHDASSVSCLTGRDEVWRGSEPLEQSQQSSRIEEDDAVGDINHHTQGTEFYGTSSNFVLLNQFFVYAQKNLQSNPTDLANNPSTPYLFPVGHDAQGTRPESGVTTRLPLSIVNILSDKQVLEPNSRAKTPEPTQEDNDGHLTRSDSRRESTQHGPSNDTNLNGNIATSSPLDVSKHRLEREYVRQFINNLHHLHPMLDPSAFTARCERLVWASPGISENSKNHRHFLALYHIVVAVGALTSGSNVPQSTDLDMDGAAGVQSCSQPPSSQELSKKYFRRSRVLLGDVFEVCSLESAQTLFLMSLYCQNALKPHACYMYCGHAVRTALAIGIAREVSSSSAEERRAARRTWWCIYSHEIDMSCSAGRRDSLGKPRNYQIDLPHITDQSDNTLPEKNLEKCSVMMINEMVHFAAILRRISKGLYYDSKGLTLLQKSIVAKGLDAQLHDWKSRLPSYLDFNTVSFREPEWAAKQKLVLQLRYLNARILVHRPFIGEPIRSVEGDMLTHVNICLDAARETIRVMYDAYTNRHYFRSWWYNATYTLYAGMIVLYIIMLGPTTVSHEELLADAARAYEILHSMEEAVVARRSANLIQEGLQVAQACVQRRQNDTERTSQRQNDAGSQVQSNSDEIANQVSHAVPEQEPGLLASIIDPNLLQDFMAADQDDFGMQFSFPSLDSLYGEGLDGDSLSML